MRILKKVTAFLLAFVMSGSMIILAHAATTTPAVDADTLKKADTLNKLAIMQQSTNLNESIQRCHAAAFIVRMMGKEAYVLANAEKYKKTGFSDVKVTEWYAPYIGYCVEQNILSGNNDGTFKPTANISDKAFLKISLNSLGYVYEKDYTWDNVFKFAYDKGIVKEVTYANKTVEAPKFTRKEIVGVLSSMLVTKKKDSNLTVIQSLVADKIITRDLAVSCGLITDSLKTAIDSITSVADNRISIKFNEEIMNTANTQITINESSNASNILTPTVESVTGKEMVVKTSMQKQSQSYSVQIKGISDVEGNPADLLVGSFTGYKAPEITSDFFKLKKVEAVSKNVINVYFTQPVNTNAEVPTNYEILDGSGSFVKGTAQNMVVKALSSANNGVTIYIKDKSLVEAGDYTLVVSGNMSSAYGVKLNDLRGDTMAFRGKGNDNLDFKLINITVMSSKILQLEFNKDVNPNLAQQIYNYYLTDSTNNPIPITKAVLSGEDSQKGKVVRLTTAGVFDKTKTYYLQINSLSDVTRQMYITEVKYPFDGNYNTTSNLQITNIVALDAGTVAVYFNRPLDADSASLVSNFIIRGVTNVSYVTNPMKTSYNYDVDPYMVELYLPSSQYMFTGYTYRIQVQTGLKDYFGNSPTSFTQIDFVNANYSTAKPFMKSATIISADSVKVVFSKDVAMDAPNIMSSNYTMEYSDGGNTITLMPNTVTCYDSTTFIMKFDSLDFNAKYTLKFKILKDGLGVNTGTQSDGNNSVQVTMGKQ